MSQPSNDEATTMDTIKEQLTEKRPLPLGRQEFEEFCERIWTGALIKGEPGNEELLKLSVQSLLADEIVHLPGSQTHAEDIYFINRARKLCSNQVAITIKGEIHKKIQTELARVRGETTPAPQPPTPIMPSPKEEKMGIVRKLFT